MPYANTTQNLPLKSFERSRMTDRTPRTRTKRSRIVHRAQRRDRRFWRDYLRKACYDTMTD